MPGNDQASTPVVLVAEPQALPAMWLEDTLADAGYALLVGVLGASIGLGASLIFVVVGLTSANGVFSWLLYRPYARDTEVRA